MKLDDRYTILRAPVGSTIHGLHLEGTDDRDEMGIAIEPLKEHFDGFEQYIYRTATERTGKNDAPSQPGDLDLTIYSLKKYVRLALDGNPTILTLLFVPTKDCLHIDARGAQLRDLVPSIISRKAGKRYLGYLTAQRQRLLGERGGKKVHRAELEKKYGYDTKYACHMVRLGFQGVELLTSGKVSFPMTGFELAYCRNVRVGAISLDQVLTKTGELERELEDLLDTSPLPEAPDRERVETWMRDTYFNTWRADESAAKPVKC